VPHKNILIVAHQPSPNTKVLAEAALKACHHEALENINAKLLTPFETHSEDVLKADGIILGTTENLGYMSGALKDFFDRCYYDVLEEKQGLPLACFIRAGSDGTGTQRGIETIVTGLKWRWVQQALICQGDWQESFVEQVAELCLSFAAQLDLAAS
jgi:multimeric flavodoxin WrbA